MNKKTVRNVQTLIFLIETTYELNSITSVQDLV
jgi:hypothetical protein